MRVVFDGYWWVEGPLSNQMVQRHFILTWLRDYPDDQATVVVPRSAVALAREQLDGRATVIGTRLRPHGVAAAIATARVARRDHADIIVNHNFTPLAGNAVTFIHDVLFQDRPEWFTLAERVYLAPIPLLARRARAVATSSQNEARRIESFTPRLGQVAAVGLSIGTGLTAAPPARPAGLPTVGDFVLTVGRLNIRKNLARTIAAAVRSPAITPTCPLVVVGEPDGRGLEEDDEIAKARADGVIIFLSKVNDGELAWLYANTRLFVFLTLDEGWGLPPQEALFFGAPTLVSDIPVFRETIGNAAARVDPLDPLAIAAEFTRLLGASPELPRSPRREQADVDGEWSACTKRLRNLAVRIVDERSAHT